MDIPFHAQVVDSAGVVVRRSPLDAASLEPTSLLFEPESYAYNARVAGQRLAAPAASDLPPDGIQYYLQVYPVPGTDLSQVYTIGLEVSGGVPPKTAYLPLVLRDAQ
jgi:hypothetical protein